VPGELGATKRQKRQQAADVQTVGGRIKADIDRTGAPTEVRPQLVGCRRHQPAGVEILEER